MGGAQAPAKHPPMYSTDPTVENSLGVGSAVTESQANSWEGYSSHVTRAQYQSRNNQRKTSSEKHHLFKWTILGLSRGGGGCIWRTAEAKLGKLGESMACALRGWVVSKVRKWTGVSPAWGRESGGKMGEDHRRHSHGEK